MVVYMTTTMNTLYDYTTGECVRPATTEESEASRKAAELDGGAGVIETTDVPRAYVLDGGVTV